MKRKTGWKFKTQWKRKQKGTCNLSFDKVRERTKGLCIYKFWFLAIGSNRSDNDAERWLIASVFRRIGESTRVSRRRVFERHSKKLGECLTAPSSPNWNCHPFRDRFAHYLLIDGRPNFCAELRSCPPLFCCLFFMFCFENWGFMYFSFVFFC